MIVVADAGPLHYLILLDHAELLHRFYGLRAALEQFAEIQADLTPQSKA